MSKARETPKRNAISEAEFAKLLYRACLVAMPVQFARDAIAEEICGAAIWLLGSLGMLSILVPLLRQQAGLHTLLVAAMIHQNMTVGEGLGLLELMAAYLVALMSTIILKAMLFGLVELMRTLGLTR